MCQVTKSSLGANSRFRHPVMIEFRHGTEEIPRTAVFWETDGTMPNSTQCMSGQQSLALLRVLDIYYGPLLGCIYR